MNRRSRRSQKTIFSVVGMAIAIPLIAIPASASLDGNFQIRAQNTADSQFEATAGMKGVGSGNGGGGSEGGGESGDGATDTGPDYSAGLANYNCGPLGFSVTETMLETSDTNNALYSQGATSGFRSTSGIQSILSVTPEFDPVYRGFPANGAQPAYVQLNSKLATGLDQNGRQDGFEVSYTDGELLGIGPGACEIFDLRYDAADGEAYGFAQSGTRVTEKRYVLEGGKLNAVSIDFQDNETAVTRTESPVSSRAAKSDTIPSKVTVYAAGSEQKYDVTLSPATANSGYDTVRFFVNADGSGSVNYNNGRMPGSDGDAPSSLTFDSAGNFTQLADSSGNGVMNPDGSPATTVAEYNAATGKNWDGSYKKFNEADYDLAVPFQRWEAPLAQ